MQQMTHDNRVDLAKAIMDLFDNWCVEARDRINLLGLPAETRPRQLQRYRKDTPLPDSADMWQRVEHLLGIADALHTTYPLNDRIGAIWLHRRNLRFGKRSPLAHMMDDGLEGLVDVRSHLDCSYEWHLDDLRAAKAKRQAEPALHC